MRPAKASPFGRGVTEGDGEGKPVFQEPLRSDGQALCQSDTIAASGIRRQHPCPLSRAYARQLPQRGSHWHVGQALLRTTSQSASQTAPLVGEPLAKRRSFPLCQSLPSVGATATTAASGGNREELLGPRPAGCERQRSRRWEPQPGQWHCEAMTERLSSSPSGGPAPPAACLRSLREFVENARQKREEFVKVIKMPRRY